MPMKTHRWLTPTLSLCIALALAGLPRGWALPTTQDLKGEVVNEKGEPIAGAVCTATAARHGELPDEGLSVTTGEKGEFSFPGLLPGTYALTCAAVGRQLVAKNDLEVTDTQLPFVQVALPPEIVVREKVEVHGQAPTIAQQNASPPATLASPQLAALPLAQQKFKAALPLVPGVVRTPDGKINIKGAMESQGLLLVDSAETVDPVTGSFAIDVPIDAVESLEVYKSAYRAEYGRFSGGLTSIQTKPPSNQWHFEVNDLLPTLRIKSGHIVGLADDSPRLNFTGPVLANKLNFSESFIYDVNKQPVRGLAWPHNETKTQSLNSFTSFQYIFSPQHLMTVNVNLFPLRRQFADINSLVPQTASSDYGQRGFSVAATDRYLLGSGAVLTTLVQGIKFDSYAHGQGREDMLVTPNGWAGNFFNAYSRTSNQQEALQTFEFPHKEWHGKHELKLGGDFVHRTYSGTSGSRPVRLFRQDGSLAEQINFTGPGSLAAQDSELAVFTHDHWVFSDQLALDMGLRYSGQTIGEPAALAPRAGLVYSPGTAGKTILRAGLGIFYDRVPLLAGDFTDNPTRVVSFFDEHGMPCPAGGGQGIPSPGPLSQGSGACPPLGSPLVFRNAYLRVDEKGRRITPSRHRLDSTPYNATWNLEADRELRPHVVVRFSYLSSRTYNVFTVDPLHLPGSDPVLLLSNTGGSRYHEFESTLRVRPREDVDLNFSYVRSLARGDLNTLGQVFVPFEQPVIRPNFYADLPSNVPHRVVTWGRFKIPWGITASPVLDVHTGFPYSAVDALQNYVGAPNSQRFPGFFSLDLKLTKDFRVPFIPWLKNHQLRGALAIFNITNHANPRDVFSNIASPDFGHFVGFQHRLYDTFLDIIY